MAKKSVSSNPKVHPVSYEAPSALKGAAYNPRKIELPELHRLAHNIAIYGFVESVTACKEDNELIGGHQRVRAALMLLKGEYVPRDKDGNELVYEKPKTIPVIFIEGLTVSQRKALNLSLNKIGGTWDEDKVSVIVRGLHEEAMQRVGEYVDETEKHMAAISELMVTGFSQGELNAYMGAGVEGTSDMPLPPPPLPPPPPPPRIEGVKGVQPNTRIPLVFYVDNDAEAQAVKAVFSHAKREYELNGPLLHAVAKWLDANRDQLNSIVAGGE